MSKICGTLGAGFYLLLLVLAVVVIVQALPAAVDHEMKKNSPPVAVGGDSKESDQ